MSLSLPIRSFAIARMAVGAGLMVAPAQISALFLLPTANIALFPSMLAGTRDFGVGALLLYAGNKYLKSQQSVRAPGFVGKSGQGENDALIGSTEGGNGSGSGSVEIVKAALYANILIDSLDLLAVTICYLEGLLPAAGAAAFAGGAAAFVGWGVWGLRAANAVKV